MTVLLSAAVRESDPRVVVKRQDFLERLIGTASMRSGHGSMTTWQFNPT